jgi:hypothetical protein
VADEGQHEERFALPAELFLAFMRSRIRGCELKVALVTLLLTRQHPDREGVPISQKLLQQVTRYSPTQVSDALMSLVAEGVLLLVKPHTVDRPGEYAFNEDFERWGTFSVNRLEVLRFLRSAAAEPAAGKPVETPMGVSAEPEVVSALAESYITSLQSEEGERSSLIEDGLNEEGTDEAPRPTAQTILRYALGFRPNGVFLSDGFKKVLGGHIKALLKAGENADFIKEAARRLVANCRPRKLIDANVLPAFLNDVKRERKNWQQGHAVPWHEGQTPARTTLEELASEQERLAARPLTAEELLALLEKRDT